MKDYAHYTARPLCFMEISFVVVGTVIFCNNNAHVEWNLLNKHQSEHEETEERANFFVNDDECTRK